MARDDRVQRDVLSETVPGRQLESGEVSLVPPQLDGALAELAEQYIIEAQAGAGGMGAVYRAVERSSGERLALKVMLPSDAVDADARANDVERFVREAASLAELSHPCIVRYRMHGSTRSGTAFLGMEWLDGEDLARRLSRAPLTTTQTVTLLRQACQGVAVVHALGIVHRDLKPSNLFLVDGDPSRAKLLDFGIARRRFKVHPLTPSNIVLGTVGYMSPEQALGAQDVDARSDVFSLGCVLFECLTGRAAFCGASAVAVLAKVLSEEPPRPSELCPDLGVSYDALVAGMLAKDRTQRFADAGAVLRALDEIVASPPRSVTTAPRAGLTTKEQRIHGVILAEPRATGAPKSEVPQLLAEVNEVARLFDVQPMRLRDGTLIMLLAGQGSATDHAAQAARCGLRLRARFPYLRIAVATGRADATGRVPVGAAIDRAAQLLAANPSAPAIAVCHVTAALLDARFVVERTDDGAVALEERPEPDDPRELLGKATLFVGREKELGLLELTLRECIADSVARVVLVTGPPGQGKSRLQHEFCRSLQPRAEVRVLRARADPLGAGSPFLLARQLVRRAIGCRDGDALAVQLEALRAHAVELNVADPLALEFLGELIAGTFHDGPCPELRAARNDPQIMNLWLRRAFSAWLCALSAAGPVLIVLEDVHWGDATTLNYLADALREIARRPVLLLALARPDASSVLPELLRLPERQQLELGGLTPRAATALARDVLGSELEASVLARIVERADGNPFHLEELLRCVAERGADATAESVVSLVQSRLERLDPEARRIARAASIFGERCWRGGLLAVLGAGITGRELDAGLDALSAREILIAQQTTSFPGHVEYLFRHGLVREAAYAMLTDDDRRMGNVLAAEWLENAGEQDALRLAHHYEQGTDTSRAIRWLVKASQAAADGGNTGRTIDLAQRGIACGAERAERGHLLLLHAQAIALDGNWRGGANVAREALLLLPTGSTSWFRAAATLLLAASFLGEPDLGSAVLEQVLQLEFQPEPSGPYGFALCAAIHGLLQMGHAQVAAQVLERARACRASDSADPVFVAWLSNADSLLSIFQGNLAPALKAEARAMAAHAGAGTALILAELYHTIALCQTGHRERCTAAAETLLGLCRPLGLSTLTDWLVMFVNWVRICTGVAGDRGALEALLQRPDPFLVLNARALLAMSAVVEGDLARAADGARQLRAGLPDSHAMHASAISTEAYLELSTGSAESALALAEYGLELTAEWIFPLSTGLLHFTQCEALHRLGRVAQARRALFHAREILLQTAGTLEDGELRAAFLAVPVHAQTLGLAQTYHDA